MFELRYVRWTPKTNFYEQFFSKNHFFWKLHAFGELKFYCVYEAVDNLQKIAADYYLD